MIDYTASLISFLKLKAAAFLDVGNGPNTVAAGNDIRLTSLKSAAFRDVGTVPGTVMAADDSRVAALGSALSSASAAALPKAGGVSTGLQTFQAGIAVSGPAGFFGAPPVGRPVLTGSRSAETDVAASMRAALVSLGLVTDGTVA